MTGWRNCSPIERDGVLADMRTPESKIMTLGEARIWRGKLRVAGRRLALTNGCFDLMHRGHAEYLAEARGRGDALLDAVNSDASVAAVKGPGRPVGPQGDRAYLLASLEATDAVVLFDTPNAIHVFEALVPDVYVKGGDYAEKTLNRDEYPVLKALGCQFEFVPFVTGFSTTRIIDQVRRGETLAETRADDR